VRELCGEEFVIGVRMNGKEWSHELGTTAEEAAEFGKLFEAAGADYLQVSAYGYGEFWMCAFPDYVTYPEVTDTVQPLASRTPDGALLPEAAIIKEAVSIPVIASSGAGCVEHFLEVFTKTEAESALAAGIFHRCEVPIGEVKRFLAGKVEVRL